MRFKDKTFEKEDVVLDGNEYIDCAFNNCRMIYRGSAGVVLNGIKATGCSWDFDGPAANAVVFLRALYAQGGELRTLVERTIANIRGERAANH